MTPRADGFIMPAEWERHTRCWMAWPTRVELWGDGLKAAQRAYAEVASTIADYEPVTMIARSETATSASLMCGKGVSVLPIDHDDAWLRDTAPSFVRNAAGEIAGVHWGFDGYGEKYKGHERDQQVGGRILEHTKLQRYAAPLVFEGGAVHVDGEGTGLVCAGSALDPRRNPDIDRAKVEEVLRDYLGVERVIWLENGLIDDETGGHVDNLACFAAPGRVVALVGKDKADPDYDGLQANLAVLQAATDAQGRQLEVVEVQQPSVKTREDGRRLTRSYLNFYIANDAVILPVFEDSADDAAIKAVRGAFPKREIVPLVANDIVHGGGGIHCITQQQPGAEASDAPREPED
ncbi:agmatine deiminase family protein [Marinivivus vitaminiproducens]|uniref:agmatine deiminase family protein n=1 Tax=Marinivivus vitaminiproducens TaxID=3035935 RepID=UPI0027A5F196|nr:agmatine deiminase family protein [Geminicoccaceae bacterium SCSIO 64248]